MQHLPPNNRAPVNYMNDQRTRYTDGRRRGGCLSTVLALLMLSSVLFGCGFAFVMVGGAGYSSRYYARSVGFEVLISIGLQILTFFSAKALWEWKRSGYTGLRAAYVIAAVVNLLTGEFAYVLGNIVALVIITALVSEIEHLLEA